VFNVRLENFEGPLDLLLYFIKRDKIDIYDIPISKITSEYIDVINTAKKLDVSIAGEFLFMASLLLRLKTRMLLPRQQDEEGLDIDDPRINLVGQLLQYKNFRNIAHQLKGIHEENKDIFYRPNDKISFEKTINPSDFLNEVSLFDISKIFQSAIDNAPQDNSFTIVRETISLEEQKQFIISNFKDKKNILLSSLIKKLDSKLEIIVTFLAVLNMIKESELICKQKNTFEDIQITLNIITA
jgi:segregation and condensation protein A|tara:strand:- start:1290 stop:2012 length:723 start_codon:yes stop_codon:yes gene_type:complete